MSYTTTWVYNAMKEFCDTRTAARAEYLKTMQELDGAQGSQYYADRQAAAWKTRTDTVAAADAKCRQSIGGTFETMHRLNRARKMEPPTEEQLRLLQMLKMRETVGEADLMQAANTLADNPAALAVLNDIGKKHGNYYDYSARAAEYTISEGDTAISRLAEKCYELMKSGASPARLYASTAHARRYGGQVDEDALPQVPPFESEADFEKYMGYGDKLKNATIF